MNYVRNPHSLDWGTGVVIQDLPDKWVLFFDQGGRRKLSKAVGTLEPVAFARAIASLEAAAATSPHEWANGHHSVYVVELDSAVAKTQTFKLANPEMAAGAPCMYVGLTGLSPEQRFANHLQGHKASAIVHKFGKRLLRPMYERYNPLPYDVGKILEPELAVALRARRFGVWQN